MRRTGSMLVLLVACGGNKEPTDVVLPCDGAWPVYDEEMLFGAGGFTASLIVEEPPAVGENLWIVDLRNASDAPVNGASVTLTPNQIDTGALLEPESYQSSLGGGPGRYAIDPFTIPEAGGWRFEFLVASGMQNRVLPLELCIE